MTAAPRLRPLLSLALLAAFGAGASAQTGFLSDAKGIVAWGNNGSGQVSGTPTTGTYTAIAGGGFHSLALRPNNTIVAWGSNGSGQVSGTPTGIIYAAIAAGYSHSLALRTDGSIISWGNNSSSQVSATPTTGTYTAIAAGASHSLALRADGSIAAWGANTGGQVSGTPTTGSYLAVAGGYEHSLALRADGSIAAWGTNTSGQVRGAPTTGVYTAVAAGAFHSLALRADGSIAAWGIVNGTPTTGTYTAIAAGATHSLALRSDGSIVAWGNNNNGQLTGTPTTGVYTAVAAGEGHSLALVAQTDYAGDLLVTDTGVRAAINRNVNVAGSVTIDTASILYNASVLSVAGDLRFGTAGSATGTGVIQARALAGSGSGTVSGGARVNAGLESTSRFTGALTAGNGGAIGFTGTGALTPRGLATVGSGEVRIDAGQRVLVTGAYSGAGLTTLRGNANVLGGGAELEVLGAANVAAGTGLLSGRDATMRFGQGLTNAGSIALTGGTNDVYGDVANTGAITLTGGATGTFYDDVTNNGTLTVRRLGTSTATAIFLGSFSGAGSVTGGGNVLIEGDLRPGNSPASVLMDASLGLGAGANTLIEIAGTETGRYDQVRVTGDLALAGRLGVSFLDGYRLGYGDTFDIFTVGGTRTGMFDGLADGATVGRYNGLDLKISYGQGARLQAVPEPATLAALGLGAAALLRRRRRSA